MNPHGFERAMGRSPRRSPSFGIPVRPNLAASPAILYQYWHPDREGVEAPPAAFAAQLLAINPDLRACRPPARAPLPSRPWLVWYRRDRITHHLSPGWMLLFCWQERETDAEGRTVTIRELPLDNRVFANLYRISARAFGDASGYFASVVQRITADKRRIEDQQREYRHDRSNDLFEARKIKNIGRGSKFALHHDGSVVPSRGEANWSAENEQAMLPGDVLRQRREERERRQDERPRPRRQRGRG